MHHLLVFTDSMNCIKMFNKLNTQDAYNELLLFIMHILITTKSSLHVFHIPGADNVIADALSCNLPMVAAASLPGLNIHIFFEPPHSMMGLQE